jgi:hypothetical protein
MLLAGLNEPLGIYQRNCVKRILQPCFLVLVDLLKGCDLFEVIWIFRFVTLRIIACQQERQFILILFQLAKLSIICRYWSLMSCNAV